MGVMLPQPRTAQPSPAPASMAKCHRPSGVAPWPPWDLKGLKGSKPLGVAPWPPWERHLKRSTPPLVVHLLGGADHAQPPSPSTDIPDGGPLLLDCLLTPLAPFSFSSRVSRPTSENFCYFDCNSRVGDSTKTMRDHTSEAQYSQWVVGPRELSVPVSGMGNVGDHPPIPPLSDVETFNGGNPAQIPPMSNSKLAFEPEGGSCDSPRLRDDPPSRGYGGQGGARSPSPLQGSMGVQGVK